MKAALFAALLGVVAAGCSAPPSATSPQSDPGSMKSILKTVDAGIVAACEGLAQGVALKSGADAQRIIATTCAVENVTRTLRELLLSQQLDTAKAAGVLVPNINSGALEDAVPESQDAE